MPAAIGGGSGGAQPAGGAVRDYGPATPIQLRPIRESDLPVLERLAVDPRSAIRVRCAEGLPNTGFSAFPAT